MSAPRHTPDQVSELAAQAGGLAMASGDHTLALAALLTAYATLALAALLTAYATLADHHRCCVAQSVVLLRRLADALDAAAAGQTAVFH